MDAFLPRSNAAVIGATFPPEGTILVATARFKGFDKPKNRHCGVRIAVLYDKFVDVAVASVSGIEQLLEPDSIVKKHVGDMVCMDQKTVIKSRAFQSTKIRMLRAAVIDGGDGMQVFNMAIFPRPSYDVPIFCADFFTTLSRNIFVLDLNPLYNVEVNKAYKDKYYTDLLPLVRKHAKLLPWGEKLTAESLQFFSPIVLWSKPERSREVDEAVYLAFQDYILVWTKLMSAAASESDEEAIYRNKEAQHRYLTWRAFKDPGRPMLRKLLGEDHCEHYIHEFLFNGLNDLDARSFTDYFPEYRSLYSTLRVIRERGHGSGAALARVRMSASLEGERTGKIGVCRRMDKRQYTCYSFRQKVVRTVLDVKVHTILLCGIVSRLAAGLQKSVFVWVFNGLAWLESSRSREVLIGEENVVGTPRGLSIVEFVLNARGVMNAITCKPLCTNGVCYVLFRGYEGLSSLIRISSLSFRGRL